jgi:SAM-dependent methyltransferase
MALTPLSRSRASWDANAGAWTRWVRERGDPHREVLLDPAVERALGRLRGLQVIDLGCGEGRFARRMARGGARVLGVDLSPALIRRARAARGRVGNPRYRVADLTHLHGVPGGRYDRALAYLSLVNVPRLGAALRKQQQKRLNVVAQSMIHSTPGLVAVISHPCFSTPDGGWEAELPVVPHGPPRLRRLFVGRYFGRRTERFRFSPEFPALTVNYHRPLGEHLEGIARAGLRLEQWIEPRPSAALARREPAWRPHRELPLFAVWAARKPGPRRKPWS